MLKARAPAVGRANTENLESQCSRQGESASRAARDPAENCGGDGAEAGALQPPRGQSAHGEGSGEGSCPQGATEVCSCD